MSLKSIKTAEATNQQLKAYASTHLGLTDIPNNAPRVKVEQAIASVSEGGVLPEHIMVEADPIAPAAQSEPASAAVLKEHRDMVRSWSLDPTDRESPHPSHVVVTINAEQNGSNHPVPVGVNGAVMAVPRGKPSRIPWPYYVALVNASQTAFTYNKATQEYDTSENSSYPFNAQPAADATVYVTPPSAKQEKARKAREAAAAA